MVCDEDLDDLKVVQLKALAKAEGLKGIKFGTGGLNHRIKLAIV